MRSMLPTVIALVLAAPAAAQTTAHEQLAVEVAGAEQAFDAYRDAAQDGARWTVVYDQLTGVAPRT